MAVGNYCLKSNLSLIRKIFNCFLYLLLKEHHSGTGLFFRDQMKLFVKLTLSEEIGNQSGLQLHLF